MKIHNWLNKILIILTLLIAFNSDSYSQSKSEFKNIWENKKESNTIRFKAIMDYYRKYTFSEPDSVLLVIDYHYDLAKKIDLKTEMATALNERSYAYYLKGDTKKSMIELNKTINIYKELEDYNTLATIYGNMGNIYGEERKYKEAVIYFNNSLKIFQDQSIQKGEARMLNNLGIVYYELDNYKLALSHYNKALKIHENLGLINKNGTTLSHIGSVYFKQGKYKEAINKGENALKILLGNNNKFSAADTYFLLAKSYKKLNQNDQAAYYVNQSLEIDQKIKNSSRIIERLTFKADLLYDIDINEASIKAFDILKLVDNETENELKVNLYALLYKCSKAEGNYALSLSLLEEHNIYNDSLQIEKNNIAIIQDAIQKEHEEEIYNNKLENERNKIKTELNHVKKTYTIIAISILIISLILYFTRKNILSNRNKRNTLLEEIERLKNIESSTIAANSNKFELDRVKIEQSIKQKLNETDWTVLNILLDDPVISNKEIAEKSFMSVDGIGSSLRRMYLNFKIKESKYKKISLLMDAIKLSNN